LSSSSSSPNKSSPQSINQRSPSASPVTTSAPSHLLHNNPNGKVPDHVEVERLRAAAATEITTDEVKPIQTDFHFFVKENVEKYRKLAEEEVRSSMKDTAGDLDPFLVNSNLNSRLLKAWEELKKEDRESYMVLEEDDRRRFMEEDEIASRHCATLTARGKSPSSNGSNNNTGGPNRSPQSDKPNREERQESETKPATTPDRDGVKRSKGDNDDNDGAEEKKVDDMEVETTKRPMSSNDATNSNDDDPEQDTQESPTKRNKIAGDGEQKA
jgi:hypothetical protein